MLVGTFLRNFVILSLVLVSILARASNSGVTYQGRILKPDGSPLAGANVQFRLQVRTPDAANCLMFEEVQSLDMRNSNGSFSLTMADGSGSRMDSTGWNLDRIFANRGTFTFAPSSCTSGTTYAPNPSDGRNFVVLFKDETMSSWEPIPPAKINFVPFAFESKQIAGFGADSLLRVIDGSGDPLTGLTPLSNAQYTALMALANGTSTAYSKTGELNGVALPAMTSGEVLGWNGATWVSTTSTPGASSITTAMLQDTSVTGAKLDPAISIATSGTVASAITTTRDFKIYAASPSTFYVGMKAPALAATYNLTWPMTAGSANQVLTTDGSGALTWTTPAGTGISALSGDVTASGSGAVAATVAAVGTSTAAQVHSAELLANAATNANVSSTIVKRDASGNFISNNVTVNGLSLNNAGSVFNLVNPIGGAWTMTIPATAGSSGQVLSTNGSGVTSWVNQPTSPWTVQAPGINYLSGSVGIGTTSPVAMLDVVGSTIVGAQGLTSPATLTTTINATDTTIVANNTAGYPPTGLLQLEDELIGYAGISGNTFTGLNRGMYATTATSHPGGTNRSLRRVNLLVRADSSSTKPPLRVLSDGSIQGGSATVSQDPGIALGGGTAAGIFWSVAIGRDAYSGGDSSVAFGRSISTGYGATSMGFGNAAGTASVAGGQAYAPATSSTAFGQFNKPTGTEDPNSFTGTDVLFSLGNGASNAARSNALLVFQNGQTIVGGNTTVAVPSGNAILNPMGSTTNSAGAALNATDSSGSSILYARNDGRVGIGTTSPGAALDLGARTDAVILPSGTSAQRPSTPINGMARYNTTLGKMEFYDGGQWVSYLTQVNANAPSGTGGTGYLVLSNTLWDGNLGGLAGANAKCRTELSTYAWKNKPGTLDTSKIFAFLCDKSSCQTPQALVNYYYAVANDTSIGGSGFSTDAAGMGPNDTFAMTANDRFGAYGSTYWVGTRSFGDTTWSNYAASSYEDCSTWSSNSPTSHSSFGQGSDSRYYRFSNYPSAFNETCNVPHRLICFVNP